MVRRSECTYFTSGFPDTEFCTLKFDTSGHYSETSRNDLGKKNFQNFSFRIRSRSSVVFSSNEPNHRHDVQVWHKYGVAFSIHRLVHSITILYLRILQNRDIWFQHFHSSYRNQICWCWILSPRIFLLARLSLPTYIFASHTQTRWATDHHLALD